MKKITIMVFISLLVAPVLAQAATTDFTADANITVSGVTMGDTTVDLLIMSGSTAASWTFNSGTFTVTDPGTFNVGSSDSTVNAIKMTNSNSLPVPCSTNTTPGTSYVTAPTDSGTYTITPMTESCDGGGVVGGGGGGGGGSTPSTYQTYDPNTGELTTDGATETADTTTTTTTPTVADSTAAASADTNITEVKADAANVATKSRAEVAVAAGKGIDTALEAAYDADIVERVVASESSVASQVREKIVTFVTYGSPTTDKLGAGERGGVVNSFKEAFGKLPQTNEDWEDVVKIANGRWPGQTDSARETVAEGNFEAIYLRTPDRTSPNDDAAVVVMAYGLRSRNRNLDSEKAAIKIYEDIFNRAPSSATSWDAVRAIAYSGATR